MERYERMLKNADKVSLAISEHIRQRELAKIREKIRKSQSVTTWEHVYKTCGWKPK